MVLIRFVGVVEQKDFFCICMKLQVELKQVLLTQKG